MMLDIYPTRGKVYHRVKQSNSARILTLLCGVSRKEQKAAIAYLNKDPHGTYTFPNGVMLCESDG